MPGGTNWVQILEKMQSAMDTLNQVKSMVGAFNDLNFSSLMAGLGADMLSQLPALDGISDSMMNGLSAMSGLAAMNGSQMGLLATISGIPQATLNTIARGGVPEGFGTDEINGLVNDLGGLAGLGQTATYLSDYATSLGATELTPDIVQQAMAAAGGQLPGMPAPMAVTPEAAAALLGTVERAQNTLGGSLSSIGTSLSAIFPSGSVAGGTLSADILSACGIDAGALASQVEQALGGSGGAVSSLTSAAGVLGEMGSAQLADLTSGIYNVQNIQARIQRMLVFQVGVSVTVGPIGISISL